MKNKRLEYFKAKLLKERERTLKTLEAMDRNQPKAESIKEESQELSSYDNHPADQGTELFMATMQANLENHQDYRLVEIDRALESIENGNYGLCQLCGNNILEERLEVMPEANICMECAQGKLEAYKLDHDRPVEEDPLSPSYRTSYKDYNDYTGFDGEDAYQAVASFNKIPDDPSFATGDHLGVFDDHQPGAVEEIENIGEAYYRSQLPYTGHGIMDIEEGRDNKRR